MWFTVGLLIAIFGAAYLGAKYGGLAKNQYLQMVVGLAHDEAAKARRATKHIEGLLVAAAKHSVAEGKVEVEKALAEFQKVISISEDFLRWAGIGAEHIEDKVESVAKTVIDKIKKVL